MYYITQYYLPEPFLYLNIWNFDSFVTVLLNLTCGNVCTEAIWPTLQELNFALCCVKQLWVILILLDGMTYIAHHRFPLELSFCTHKFAGTILIYPGGYNYLY